MALKSSTQTLTLYKMQQTNGIYFSKWSVGSTNLFLDPAFVYMCIFNKIIS